jgi:hypothetical protein
MTMLADVKAILRIGTAVTAFNTEITDLINAAKADLGISGLLDNNVVTTDPLIRRAIITYCKANFGWDNPDAEKLQKAYEMLKTHMALTNYAYYTVTFTLQDSTPDPIKQAKIVLKYSKDNEVERTETKFTNDTGQAVFRVRPATNYEYLVTADGFQTEESFFDVTANKVFTLTLTEV